MLRFLNIIPLRTKLALGYVITMGLLFAALGFGILRYVEHELYDSVDLALHSSANAVIESRYSGNPLGKKASIDDILDQFFGNRRLRFYGMMLNVDRDQVKQTKASSARMRFDVTKEALEQARKGQSTFETFKKPDNSLFRQLTVPVVKTGRFTGQIVQVGASLDETLSTLQNIKFALSTSIPIALFVSMIVGYILTWRSLASVRLLTRTANNINSSGLTERIPLPRAKDEIFDLSHTFNRMLDRLQDSFVRQQHFSGNVSHELRTSLAVLRGESELALRKERSPDEYKVSLKNIFDESKHMTGIVENLLLLSRANSGKLEIQYEPIDIKVFFDELTTSLKPSLLEKSLEFDLDLSGEPIISASSSFLNIVLKNLCLNAIKHSKENSLIHIKQYTHENFSVFEIKDSGTGIPEKDLPFIFDSFYRADTARNRSVGGAGIGLSLVKALTELHKGYVEVESVLGKGSKFIVGMPIMI